VNRNVLAHLETFAEAAESGSFTAAARALGLTQAAVSQRVQALERDLGVALFHRQGGRASLTDAGRQLTGGPRGSSRAGWAGQCPIAPATARRHFMSRRARACACAVTRATLCMQTFVCYPGDGQCGPTRPRA
jgi:hypothetical protein